MDVYSLGWTSDQSQSILDVRKDNSRAGSRTTKRIYKVIGLKVRHVCILMHHLFSSQVPSSTPTPQATSTMTVRRFAAGPTAAPRAPRRTPAPTMLSAKEVIERTGHDTGTETRVALKGEVTEVDPSFSSH